MPTKFFSPNKSKYNYQPIVNEFTFKKILLSEASKTTGYLMDELKAIVQIKNGDVRGLEILVRKYQLEAVRIAVPITNDRGLAEEVVQEAFLRVYECIEQYDENRPFRAWFLRIVVNDALKIVKRQSRLVPLEHESNHEHRQPGNDRSNGKLKIVQDEFNGSHDDAMLLQEIFQELSPEHRAVLELKYYLEMSDEEIAETVQIPTGTVKSRLHAAKRNLHRLIKRMDSFVFL